MCTDNLLSLPYMLLWAIWVLSLVYMMSCYKLLVCHVPCVTTPSRITASACCPGATGGWDKQLGAPSLSCCASRSITIFFYPLFYSLSFIYFPKCSLSDTVFLSHSNKATSSSLYPTPIVWPSARAGRGPGDCGELSFHRVSHIVVTVWLTVKITLCSYRNPSTWI